MEPQGSIPGGASTCTRFLGWAAVLLAVYTPAAAQEGAVRGVHDPTIVEAGGEYWVFSTGRGIPVRRSADLYRWTSAGRVFAEPPAWTREYLGWRSDLWAPDISRFGGEYRLYYSASSFGKNRSAIGLAVTRSLDPASPDHAWVDRGKVIESRPGVDDWNAIDPQHVIDHRGNAWLAFGSYWSGIKLLRLDARTGLPAEDRTIHSLAARPGSDAIEAPFIVRASGQYYLFVSFDACCRGVDSTYRILVGRSPEITGPYVDRAERPMLEGGGTLVLASQGRVRGPGHNAVIEEGGRHWIVHHFYDAEDRGTAKLQIRPVRWDDDGWPVAGEPISGPTAGAAPGKAAPPPLPSGDGASSPKRPSGGTGQRPASPSR